MLCNLLSKGQSLKDLSLEYEVKTKIKKNKLELSEKLLIEKEISEIRERICFGVILEGQINILLKSEDER